MAAPPGLLVAVLAPAPTTVTPGIGEVATPWKLTVVPEACAGANNIKAVGFVIFVADIAMPPGG